jgi:N-acetylmuramoyl-L-alanine amidase
MRVKSFYFLLLNIFLACLWIPLSSFQPDTQPQYLQVKIVKALSIEQLLKRYQLDEYECNTTQFLKLNKMTKPQSLVQNRVYNLPILLYNFDGKTIRNSLGINNLAVAQSIQSYNVSLYNDGIRKQTYKESSILFVPHHALNCANKKVPSKPIALSVSPENIESLRNPATGGTEGPLRKPATSGTERVASKKDDIDKPIKGKGKTVRYEILGKNYQDVTIVDNKLKGKILYVESGHGGPDPGAEAKVAGRTLCEDEYAYDIALRVARELISHGGTVFIITRDPNDGIRDGEFLACDRDEQTYPDLKVPVHQKTRLFQRSDAINELYDKYLKKGITDQRLIVIHVDSRGRKEQTDTFLYYQNGNEASQKLAKKVHQTLEKKYERYREYKGTLTTRDLHMLRETKPATVFVELGNIRNDFDRKRLMLKNNRKLLAQWLAEGFMK